MSVTLYRGEALHALRALPDNSVDAVVTDPPYGLADHKPAALVDALVAWAQGDRERVPDGRGFMGRAWDRFVPPPAVWDECLRVLKPGGHLVAFAGSRTYDLMGLSIRLAGFEVRDGLQWLYGSGFPKSLDVSKAIDKARDDKADVRVVCRWLRARIDEHPTATTKTIAAAFGVHSRMVDHWAARDTDSQPSMPTVEQWERLRALLGFGGDVDDEVWRLNGRKGTWGNERTDRVIGAPIARDVFGGHGNVEHAGTPVLDEAARWHGWGTALKPGHEPMVLARKPLAGATVAANVLAHGTGALNIDGCRVGDGGQLKWASPRGMGSEHSFADDAWTQAQGRPHAEATASTVGRWPSNVLLGHGEECGDVCAPGCPVAELDAQSGTSTSPPVGSVAVKAARLGQVAKGDEAPRVSPNGHGDTGGASRYFPTFRYQAKAPARERPKVDGVAHPTVKPLALMRWLVRLVTPPGGTVLDPFAGTGTTGQAARDEGAVAVLVEREPDYWPLIRHRLGDDLVELDVLVPAPAAAEPIDPVLAAIAAAGDPTTCSALWRTHRKEWTDVHTEAVRARLAVLDAEQLPYDVPIGATS